MCVGSDSGSGDATANAALRQALGARISFDQASVVDAGYERIVINKQRSWVPESGCSLKPGNLRFNLGGVFEALVGGLEAALTASVTRSFRTVARSVSLSPSS